MRFKSQLVAFASSLVIASSAFAITPKPLSCPSIRAIHSEGISKATEVLEDFFVTYHMSQYDTASTWVFIMGPVFTDTNDAALAESNKILPSITGTPVPEMDDDGEWSCQYQPNRPNFGAYAIPADDFDSPLKAMRHFRKVP